MAHFIKQILLALFISCLSAEVALASTELALNNNSSPTASNAGPSTQTMIPSPPDVDAKSYVLMDADSGAVLAQRDMHEKLPPASLTKLMTMYVASQAIKDGRIHLDDDVLISKKAWQMGGSRMFVKVNSYVKVQDLIEGIIIASGNDACVAMAEHVAGSEDSFAELMNDNARHLGMKDTHYVDSTGLPNPNHYATAYDLALLTRAIVEDYPEDYQWYKQKWITYNNIKQPNRNRLLWRDPSVDGLKTGHTEEAGYCLIASAKRGPMRLISVVMGTPSDRSRTEDSQELLNWGFRFYETRQLFPAGKILATPRVFLGKAATSNLGLANNLYVTIPSNQWPQLKASLELPNKLKAPLVKGQAYGDVVISLNNTVISKQPLIALDDNPEAGFIKRLFDHIAMWFSGWL